MSTANDRYDEPALRTDCDAHVHVVVVDAVAAVDGGVDFGNDFDRFDTCAGKETHVAERYAVLGIAPVGNKPDEFAAQLKADLEGWEPVVRKANLRIE